MEHPGIIGYASENARKMVRALILGEGSLNDRLRDAYSAFHVLTIERWLEQAPEDLQNRIKAVKFGYDQLRADKLSSDGLQDLADQVFSLYAESSRLFWTSPTAA